LNMTTLFITHDLDVLERVSDQLLVMKAGSVIRRGSTEDLLGGKPENRAALFTEEGESAQEITASVHDDSQSSSSISLDEALIVTDLSITYKTPSAWPWSASKEHRAVRSVSLKVRSGEWVAIVGPSGCGKSSIARCLAGLLPRASGQISLPQNGNVQLVFQDPFSSLNPGHTVLKALREVLRLGGGEDTAEGLLAAVGLPAATYGDRLPAELSGGQRQRVAIARALAAGPGLLIADEAVSALDVPLRADVLDLLDSIRRRRNIGLLFISHDLRLVARRADRVLVMEAGRIVEEGPAKRVLEQPESEMGRRLTAE